MNNCTCGADKVGHPGHTNYCDSGKLTLKKDGWKTFLEMMSENVYGGTYVYLTKTEWKLVSALNFTRGSWYVLDDLVFESWCSSLLNNPGPINLRTIWAEENALTPEINELLDRCVSNGILVVYD